MRKPSFKSVAKDEIADVIAILRDIKKDVASGSSAEPTRTNLECARRRLDQAIGTVAKFI